MTDLKDIAVLVPGSLLQETLETLTTTFDLTRIEREAIDTMPSDRLEAIRGVAVAGAFTAAMMQRLPNLEIVAHFGVGYDGIDVGHALANGIMVTNTPDVLTEEVADTALGLLLMTARELSRAESHLRAGRWAAEGPYPLTATTLRGRSAGIMGLGRIGLAIARRLEAFGLSVAYHNRTPRTDVDYAYHATLEGLAHAVDTLIIAAPGGAGTDKAVNAVVLKALGPDGIFINIGRGSTVDEAALIDALQSQTIRAAGLDVFANEPNVPAAFFDLPNAVLLPHVASASQATRGAMGSLVVENLKAWFEGTEPPTVVPELRSSRLKRRAP